MKLEEILRLPEGKTLEYKRDLSLPAAALRTLVAFANSAGGRLVIGVEDGTRAVAGVPEPLGFEERIASLVADSIEPRLLPEIEVVPWRRTHVVVVTVHPSALRPHHLRAAGPGRGTYVRLGSTNRVADSALIAELGRRIGVESFDEQALADLDSEAIDFGAASQCFAARRTLRRQDLMTLGLLRQHQGRRVPTAGGILLFGRERLARFPDAYLQAGRFAGTNRADLMDRADLAAPLPLAIDQAMKRVLGESGKRLPAIGRRCTSAGRGAPLLPHVRCAQREDAERARVEGRAGPRREPAVLRPADARRGRVAHRASVSDSRGDGRDGEGPARPQALRRPEAHRDRLAVGANGEEPEPGLRLRGSTARLDLHAIDKGRQGGVCRAGDRGRRLSVHGETENCRTQKFMSHGFETD
jgi:hypothetical protein